MSVCLSVSLSVWPYHSYIWTFFSEKTVFMNSSQLLNLGSEVVWLITPDMLCRLQKNEKIGQVQKSGLQILRTLSVRNFFFPFLPKSHGDFDNLVRNQWEKRILITWWWHPDWPAHDLQNSVNRHALMTSIFWLVHIVYVTRTPYWIFYRWPVATL